MVNLGLLKLFQLDPEVVHLVLDQFLPPGQILVLIMVEFKLLTAILKPDFQQLIFLPTDLVQFL